MNSYLELLEIENKVATCHILDSLETLINSADTESLKIHASKMKESFLALYRHYIETRGMEIDWSKVMRPPASMLLSHNELADIDSKDITEMLNKLIVIKLNGGLGTTMGCKGPKSAIKVRDGMTFLDLTVLHIEQINAEYNCKIPLVLMNSFNTHQETVRIITKYKGRVNIFLFDQNKFPRLYGETLMPYPTRMDDDNSAWYPPGHGDVYQSLQDSGLLDCFLNLNKEYLFISNIDNLGATIDLKILKHMIDRKMDFVMELTEKTLADVKGGTLINYDGRCQLLELAQVPKDYKNEFKSLKKFNIFNTNNLWARLDRVSEKVKNHKLDLDVIVNEKQLNGVTVIQLETACGAAIKNFERSCGVVVSRARFLPVKSCSDLFTIMSNIYENKRGVLTRSSKRQLSSLPLVKLGAENFGIYDDFISRFASIPDITELENLTVAGDIRFGRNVTLAGNVIIIANHGNRIDIPPNSRLENNVVSGDFRILDH